MLSAPPSAAIKKAGKLTVSLALLVALLLILGVNVLGLRDPVQVALQVLLQLLLLAELLEIAASFGLLALFGKLSVREQDSECITSHPSHREDSLLWRTDLKTSPAQHTQHQVENKERSKDDQADKVDPGQLKAHRIVHLRRQQQGRREIRKRIIGNCNIWSTQLNENVLLVSEKYVTFSSASKNFTGRIFLFDVIRQLSLKRAVQSSF